MIDTHCHLDLYDDPTAIAASTNLAKVLTVMVTNLPSKFERALPYLKSFEFIRPALGLHPQLAESHSSERLRFRQLIDATSYIGEIGLDFSEAYASKRQIQIDSFEFAIESLNHKPKFITVHSRRAESSVLDILASCRYPFPVTFHWFSGSLKFLDRAIEQGHYFSVNPSMTTSSNGSKIISRIPRSRLLTETDGPFCKIAGRRSVPADVLIVEQYLSRLWSCTLSEARSVVRENFLQILKPVKRNSCQM